MSPTKNLLVITASNGENLKLAKRFIEITKKKNINSKLIDLTNIALPLYNPRTHKNDGVPTLVKSLNLEMKSFSHWIICAPEYNGSIPPVLSSAIAWLSVQEDDFRELFNNRPIGMATFSGGGGMELLLSMRIQLTHLGAQVVGRQILSNYQKQIKEESLEDLIYRLMRMEAINPKP